MTVVVIIIWWGSSFSLWSDWDAWTDGSDSMSEEMSVNLNERKENDDGSDYCVRVCLLSLFFFFFLLVVKSFGWPFCSTWTLEV